MRYRLVQLRDFTHDRHKTVDDYAYGGGAGMVLKPEPFFEAVESLGAAPDRSSCSRRGAGRSGTTTRCGSRWASGSRCSAATTRTWTSGWPTGSATEELSLGDFVLSGGEPAALCVLDAVVRLLPGALGDHESASRDSHYDGLLSPPSYTRPPEYRGHDGARGAAVGQPRRDRGVARRRRPSG